MNGTDLLNLPAANALGWTLLHALWQGFALVLPVSVAFHLLHHRSSELRYRIGVLALLGQVLVSAVTFSLYYQPASTYPSMVASADESPLLTVRWQAMTRTLPWHEQAQWFLEAHLTEFVAVYLIGVAIFALRLAGGWVYVQRIRQTATGPATMACVRMVNQLRTVLNIRPVVRVRESARIAVPMVVGFLKPVLLLPVGLATHLSMSDVEAVLAHELAHVKRHDYAVNLLQSVIEVLYFFQPALWWLSARVREEREHCCDDLAVQICGGDGHRLAQALARVEELRLEQQPVPALAMTFATKRRQLLHRVQRVLGVPTRPTVSNGSLAGLTLATLLLVSASVYAVQPDQQPKPRPAKAQSTRRHRTANGTEFGMIDNRRVDYVVWKGQKLPASRVARLQRQLDLVAAGQLSLDDVPQPDRDILLTLIETNHGFEAGMEDLAKGLARIDSDNMVADALTHVPGSPDGTPEGLAKLNYDSLVHNAIAGVSSIRPSSDSLKRMAAQRRLDSLMTTIKTVMDSRKEAISRISKEMADLTLTNANIQKQLGPVREQAGLIGQQARLFSEVARLSVRNDARSKAQLRQKEQELARLEKRIKQFEKQVEQRQQQIESSSAQTNRLSVLADSMSRLYEPVTAISEQIGELSVQISEDAMRQAEEAMHSVKDIHVDIDVPVTPRLPRVPRAPRSPRGLVEPVPPLPLVPVKPAAPAAPRRPNGRVEPARPNAVVAPAPIPPAPRPAPKPNVVPAPEPEQ